MGLQVIWFAVNKKTYRLLTWTFLNAGLDPSTSGWRPSLRMTTHTDDAERYLSSLVCRSVGPSSSKRITLLWCLSTKYRISRLLKELHVRQLAGEFLHLVGVGHEGGTCVPGGVMNASSSPHPARKSKSAINASRFIVAVCCSPGRPWAARA